MRDYIKNYITDSANTKQAILNNGDLINLVQKVAEIIISAYKNGHRVLTIGNGGSAADAQHIAAELVSKFMIDRPAMNALALTTNSSVLTAIGNDYNNDYIFSRQVQAYGQKGDILVAISTSGNSINIVNALIEAKKIGLTTVGLSGHNIAKMDEFCDFIIKVPSSSTPIIQESHIMIGHIICALVEKALY